MKDKVYPTDQLGTEKEREDDTSPNSELNHLPNAVTQANSVRNELLNHLTLALRTPLTSVMGMASVLSREIYGPLTDKQKEYLSIIQDSGHSLLSLVDEILALTELNDSNKTSNLSPVDIEMLCQHVIKTLEPMAHKREQQIRLFVEPSNLIWLLDKSKMQLILYNLLFIVIQSERGSLIGIHTARKENGLRITIWAAHPWLGNSLPFAELYSKREEFSASPMTASPEFSTPSELAIPQMLELAEQMGADHVNEKLRLLLSYQLAQMHGGNISIQGYPDSGYRYVVNLPRALALASANDLSDR